MKTSKGRVYVSKNKFIFVASGTNSGSNGCPTVNVVSSGNMVKFRDDYGKGFKIKRHFAKSIFR